MGDELPNFRGGHWTTFKELIPVLTFVAIIASGVVQMTKYADKGSVEALTTEMWRLRLASEGRDRDQAHSSKDTERLQKTVDAILELQRQQLIDEARRRKP